MREESPTRPGVLLRVPPIEVAAARLPWASRATAPTVSWVSKAGEEGFPSGAKQAAEKLDFSKSAKNGSRQDAPGTIREGWLMVFHPPIDRKSTRLNSSHANISYA